MSSLVPIALSSIKKILYSLNNFKWSIYKIIDYFSAFSNLLLGPSSEYFNLVIIFFSSRIAVFLTIFIFIFLFYSYIILMTSFKSFSVFSSNSSSIFKTDVVRLLFSNLNPVILYNFWRFTFFFLWVGNNSLFLYMSSDLLLKTGYLENIAIYLQNGSK